MKIQVTTGTGEGPTQIAAFDAALINAGIANYNLIYLSSVIPPGSVIQRGKFNTPADEYGHRLYVVLSRHDEQERGRIACAGVGWTQDEKTGRGLFVELHGPNKSQVERDIQATLDSMIASRSFQHGGIQTEIAEVECRGKPTCALAIAVYESVGWNP
jgi:arginine decarboxylase